MKEVILLTALVFTSSIYIFVSAQSNSVIESKNAFSEHTDKCLVIMERAAQEMSVKGVAVIAYIPGEEAESWISAMKVVGALHNGSANFLAVAYSKAAEMADTFKDSGGGVREPMVGEFGWQGGLIKKVNSGYILAVFSGATGEQDTQIAKEGLDGLSTYF